MLRNMSVSYVQVDLRGPEIEMDVHTHTVDVGDDSESCGASRLASFTPITPPWFQVLRNIMTTDLQESREIW